MVQVPDCHCSERGKHCSCWATGPGATIYKPPNAHIRGEKVSNTAIVLATTLTAVAVAACLYPVETAQAFTGAGRWINNNAITHLNTGIDFVARNVQAVATASSTTLSRMANRTADVANDLWDSLPKPSPEHAKAWLFGASEAVIVITGISALVKNHLDE